MGDGVGTQNLQNYLVVAQNNAEDYILGTKTWTYTYSTPDNGGSPFYVSYSACCRLTNLANGASKSLALQCRAGVAARIKHYPFPYRRILELVDGGRSEQQRTDLPQFVPNNFSSPHSTGEL